MNARWRRRDWSVLLVTCVGLFVIQLDVTVVNVATTAIRQDLATTTSAVTWVVDAYLVTFAACMIGLGDIGDRFGRRRVFLAGLGGFAVTSAGCATAADATWLIGFRALSGVAGAAVLVSSLAILTHVFAGADRTRAVGIWSAVAGTALIVGPVLGGVLVDGPGWRAVFWLNVPICVVSMVAGRLVLEDSRDPGHLTFDWPGQLTFVATLAAVSWGLSETASSRGRSVAGPGAIAAGVALCAVFLAQQRRSASPMVPLGLFTSPVFRGANLAALAINFATLGLLFLLSLYFEQVQHISAAGAGPRIVPLFAAYAAVSALAGRLPPHRGPRGPAALGAALAGAAVVVVPAVTHTIVLLAFTLAVCGAGVGLALPAVVTTAVTAAPPDRAGLASGINNAARQIGGTLGVALLGGLVSGTTSASGTSASATGIKAALLVDAAVYLLGAAVSVRTLPAAGPAIPIPPRSAQEDQRADVGAPMKADNPSTMTAVPALRLPDPSTVGTIDDGRRIVDEIDEHLQTVIALRHLIARRIQTLRMSAGGPRMQINREHEVMRRYVDALGPVGRDFAAALLLLCRGPADPSPAPAEVAATPP
jgi:MFS transporter, DHA2 family, methylenomycin A resistance protein